MFGSVIERGLMHRMGCPARFLVALGCFLLTFFSRGGLAEEIRFTVVDILGAQPIEGANITLRERVITADEIGEKHLARVEQGALLVREVRVSVDEVLACIGIVQRTIESVYRPRAAAR